MKRGEVWWANFGEPVGRRPVVLVSRDEAYAVRTKISVVEVTTRARGLATEVALDVSDGLPRASVANADNIVTVPKRVLEKRISLLSKKKQEALGAALRFALDL